ncbi:GGDEF domain-containing phosphodiesterase [Aurantiacibacter suaedae]|uniref:GGDEF domain-containing phosphodiesterase n=1 Tax=Aurantiacibacter suaedae TaxID=2545755 RepID=UPI0010F80A3A|nr:GGDEF domain-containing phosphodiesterase [Aurantiacibacter suaedae]
MELDQTEWLDRLTGVLSAGAAIKQLEEWQAGTDPGQVPPIHAMLLTVKRFSAVNLAYGKAAGDRALVEIAARMTAFARVEFDLEWLVARVTGSTFLIAAMEASSRERWQWLAEELALDIARPLTSIEAPAPVRLWPRMALLRAVAGESPARMVTRLGEALESGRHNPGKRFCWVDGTRSLPDRSAQQLEADLIAALGRDEISILYQPQFCAETGTMVGAEALARWEHPALGRIGAGAMLAIAERADHLGQLSRHIVRKALAGARDWPRHLNISLNVTSADLATRDFGAVLAHAAIGAGIAPERVIIEITEQALVIELDRSAQRLQELADRGMRIVLDDFGAGFCNFRYLTMLPLTGLKLDRSMIENLAEDTRDLAVLRGIVAMARALDLYVLAEGVETETQKAIVTEEGCSKWQGFLGARPMSASELASFIDA